MFDPKDGPRVFGIPVGVDFSRDLHDGLMHRLAGQGPTAMANVEVYVNTRRMQRRLTDHFHNGPATLLPRIRLVTDLGVTVGLKDVAPAIAPLRRKLEVAQLVRRLIERKPEFAAAESAFDLAESLVALMSEMQGEGVPPEDVMALDVADQSGHWQRALEFLKIVQSLFDDPSEQDPEGRQRKVIEHQIEAWSSKPPEHPILVAGSTGSRGATSLFMQAVSRLPQGAVILPGVDMEMPPDILDGLDADQGGEDHPQFRFKAFCDAVGGSVQDIAPWHQTEPVNRHRAALVSLSLRPAPVTDQWITDGKHLTDLAAATDEITLIEAPTPRDEADAIALRIRQAVEDGKTTALVTPDRVLTRQVTAALDCWQITPDDSAGLPLQLSAPGRLLRHVADAMCAPLAAEDLLVLLRHPLANTGGEGRGSHILQTNALELELRRNGPPFPSRNSLMAWANATASKHPDRMPWSEWVADVLLDASPGQACPLTDHVAHHIAITEALCAGPGHDGSGALWKEAAGREALRAISELRSHADAGGTMSARDYRRLVNRVLSTGEVRDRDAGDPRVLIWGTLEARVQSAELVILGGMNEGTWPEAASPDPWLNRAMRQQAGLLLPERRIGLSAHDYQQAVCAPEVVISRSVRSDEAETVPSRWVNRLTNLLGGLTDQGGKDALASMRDRGRHWLSLARKISDPDHSIEPAKRPAPRPPRKARPDQLSVTQIQTLIRDPYAIYARKVLGLKSLDPLAHQADAPLKGVIVHKVLERFIKDGIDPSSDGAEAALLHIADDVLEEHCPWPAVRTLWRARFADVAPHFLKDEVDRQTTAKNIDTEMWGSLAFPALGFTLTGKADRIDLSDEGEALIYDYKTGQLPSKNVQIEFDKQLLLEAAMIEKGAFKGAGTLRTKAAVYIGLGNDPKNVPAPLKDSPPDETLERFEGLIAKWMDERQGYTSRRAPKSVSYDGDYDHLARHGEWKDTDDPVPEDLT